MVEMIRIGRKEWRMCRAALAARFERPVPDSFWAGEVDLEALYEQLTPSTDDLMTRGRILIGQDLRSALAGLPGTPEDGINGTTPISAWFPKAGRRQAWKALQDQLEWRLPRIGLPVWAQYAYGIGLIAALVSMVWWPLLGTAAFFGGMILSYRLEQWSIAFQYPTVETTLEAMIRLNYPALEMGAADDLPLRMYFAEVMNSHFIPIENLEEAFPGIVVMDPFASPVPALHILNGDALRATFDSAEIVAKRAVIRECFVVGPIPEVLEDTLIRSAWIAREYGAAPDQYHDWVTTELSHMQASAVGSECNLWFENDLFCQANLWFTIAYLDQNCKHEGLFRVFPLKSEGPSRWEGFAGIDENGLCQALESRIPFSEADIQLGKDLWKAFQSQDFSRLRLLAETDSPCFRELPAVVEAHIDRFPMDGRMGRPEKVLMEIMSSGNHDFEAVFAEFSRREGIYGFGDLQVKSLLQRLGPDQSQIP